MPDNAKAIRIQKHLADCGIASRRQAEQFIVDGEVTVNGKVAQLGDKLVPGEDFIKLRGKPVLVRDRAEPLTLAFNKPKGVLCSNKDPYHSQTLFDLLPKEYQKIKLFCAGRLDKDSEGLVILTNDGDLAHRITHPTYEIIKRYRVTLNRPFDPAKIPAMLEGVKREGEHLFARKIIPAPNIGTDPERRLEIHLAQGRKREVRRLMEAFGYYVKKLKRIQIGNFQLKNIRSGSFRVLDQKDIDRLFSS